MVDHVEDYLDRLLAPKAIDPLEVARILQRHMPDRSLLELEALVAIKAASDGYRCISQAPPISEASL